MYSKVVFTAYYLYAQFVTHLTQAVSLTTLTGGFCHGCDSSNSVTFHDCSQVDVSSCKDLSNIVVKYSDCSEIKYDNLSLNFQNIYAANDLSIMQVWVKSGCNNSGDGPGYGRLFINPNACVPAICMTPQPTANPTAAPSATPTECPSDAPTAAPSVAPTKNPTNTPSVSPTKNPTNSPSATPSRSPTQLPTAIPSKSPTTPDDCPQKAPKIDPCDQFGRTYDQCVKIGKNLQNATCWWNGVPIPKAKKSDKEIRCWLNDHEYWNTPETKGIRLEKECNPKCQNGAFAVRIYERTKLRFKRGALQNLDCQVEWDSKQITTRAGCNVRGQWNTWIIGDGDYGLCMVRNSDNEKCYSAVRKNYCANMKTATACSIQIHCSWNRPRRKCLEKPVKDAQMHLALGAPRKSGLYFQDKKQLAGPAIGDLNPNLLLNEVGDFRNGFLTMFGIRGCNSEFNLSAANGATQVQIKCDGDEGFKTIGTIPTSAMDQSELREFIFSVPNGNACSVSLNYDGSGEVLWPKVALGGFKLAPIS